MSRDKNQELRGGFKIGGDHFISIRMTIIKKKKKKKVRRRWGNQNPCTETNVDDADFIL